jgi:hypothetical protein
MNSRQRESTAKFLYDMAKGIGLIVVVGGLVGGQANWWGAIMGLVGTITFFLIAYWLEGRRDDDATTHIL